MRRFLCVLIAVMLILPALVLPASATIGEAIDYTLTNFFDSVKRSLSSPFGFFTELVNQGASLPNRLSATWDLILKSPDPEVAYNNYVTNVYNTYYNTTNNYNGYVDLPITNWVYFHLPANNANRAVIDFTDPNRLSIAGHYITGNTVGARPNLRLLDAFGYLDQSNLIDGYYYRVVRSYDSSYLCSNNSYRHGLYRRSSDGTSYYVDDFNSMGSPNSPSSLTDDYGFLEFKYDSSYTYYIWMPLFCSGYYMESFHLSLDHYIENIPLYADDPTAISSYNAAVGVIAPIVSDNNIGIDVSTGDIIAGAVGLVGAVGSEPNSKPEITNNWGGLTLGDLNLDGLADCLVSDGVYYDIYDYRVVNTTNSTVQHLNSGTTYNYDTYQYDYSTRTYTTNISNGDVITTTYGDDYVTQSYIDNTNGTINNYYYFYLSPGTSSTDPDPSDPSDPSDPDPSDPSDPSDPDPSDPSDPPTSSGSSNSFLDWLFDLIGELLKAIFAGITSFITGFLQKSIDAVLAFVGIITSFFGDIWQSVTSLTELIDSGTLFRFFNTGS